MLPCGAEGTGDERFRDDVDAHQKNLAPVPAREKRELRSKSEGLAWQGAQCQPPLLSSACPLMPERAAFFQRARIDDISVGATPLHHSIISKWVKSATYFFALLLAVKGAV